MKTYVRRNTVRAKQWFKVGDHAAILPLNIMGPSAADACVVCGKPFSEHGSYDCDTVIVCPGDWVVEYPAGEIEIMRDKGFRRLYKEADE